VWRMDRTGDVCGYVQNSLSDNRSVTFPRTHSHSGWWMRHRPSRHPSIGCVLSCPVGHDNASWFIMHGISVYISENTYLSPLLQVPSKFQGSTWARLGLVIRKRKAKCLQVAPGIVCTAKKRRLAGPAILA
jgi:hypothetical protein